MLYLLHTPRPPLDRYIERLWLVTGGQAPRRDRILPSGTVELVINLLDDHVRIDRTERSAKARSYSGAVVSGTYSSAFVVDAAQHAAMMGVHFRPGGAPPVLGVPSAALTEAHVDLANLWSETAARELRDRLCLALTPEKRFRILEQALLGRLPAGRRVHPAVPMALARFGPDGSGSSVRDVSRESGLSHRRLLTLFSFGQRVPPAVGPHAASVRTGTRGAAPPAARPRGDGLSFTFVQDGRRCLPENASSAHGRRRRHAERTPQATAPHTFVDGVHGIRYQVRDVARSVAFYRDHLGFTLKQQQLPAFANVALGDANLLLSGPGASGSRPMPDGQTQTPGGWNRVVLKVRDLAAFIETLQAAGVRFRNELESGPGGRQIQVEDPDGNPVELFEPAR